MLSSNDVSRVILQLPALKNNGAPHIRRAFVLLLFTGCISLLTPGCGFHLRGKANLPASMNVTYLQDSHPPSNIYLPLRRTLGSNVKVTDDPNKATAILQLSNERFDRRLLSAAVGSPIKNYELHYSISFTLLGNGDKVLLAPQTINVTRELSFNETQVLAKTSEQQQLQQDMIRNAVRQILNRLQATNQ